MLRSTEALERHALATYGVVGKVNNLCFDHDAWIVRSSSLTPAAGCRTSLAVETMWNRTIAITTRLVDYETSK